MAHADVGRITLHRFTGDDIPDGDPPGGALPIRGVALHRAGSRWMKRASSTLPAGDTRNIERRCCALCRSELARDHGIRGAADRQQAGSYSQFGAVLSFGIQRGLSAGDDRLELLRRRTQARYEAEQRFHRTTNHRCMGKQTGAQFAAGIAHRHGAGDHPVDELL